MLRPYTNHSFPRALVLLAGSLALLLVNGCSPAHHRAAADKEVYRLLSAGEQSVLGRTNEFSIDTEYSHRDPDSIPPAEIIESRTSTNVHQLSLTDALRLAIENSRTYQNEKERLYLAALSYTGTLDGYDTFFSAGAGTDVTGSSDAGIETVSGTVSLGASKALKSGGSVGVNLVNSLLRFYSGSGSTDSTSGSLSASFVQPLLEGFGLYGQSRENLTQAERNLVYAIRSFAFFQNDFANDIVNNYFNLIAQQDTIRNRYANYISRVRSTERLEARSVDRESGSQVDQARQAELTAKNNYINSVAGYLSSVDQFKIQLGLPVTDRLILDDGVLADLQAAGLIPVNLDPAEAFRIAVSRQLTILNEIDRFEDAKRKVKVEINRLKPGLDFDADVSVPLTSSADSFDYANFDVENVRYGAGLRLNLPIDNVAGRNRYRSTLIAFESELRGLSLSLDSLKDSIDRGFRTLEQRRQNYVIQQNALELANRRVESTTLLQQAGRAEVRDLIESQDAQVEAQNAVTAALVSYQQARLNLLLDLGLIETSTEQFWLKEHVSDALGLPMVADGPGGAVMPGDEVIPPDEFFEN